MNDNNFSQAHLLREESASYGQGPVTCLGMTFAAADTRPLKIENIHAILKL